jgi:hypothetical protein
MITSLIASFAIAAAAFGSIDTQESTTLVAPVSYVSGSGGVLAL